MATNTLRKVYKVSAKASNATKRSIYLEAAARLMRRLLIPEAPPLRDCGVMVSLPTHGARSNSKHSVIGQCIHAAVQGGRGKKEDQMLFVHPSEFDSDVKVLAILAHEMIHAAYPTAGHRGPFVTTMGRIGLAGKPTATIPSKTFIEWVKQIRPSLPTFPKGKLEIVKRKVQGTRQRLFECSGCEKPVKIRAARDELNAMCLDCDTEFELKDAKRASRVEGPADLPATIS